MKFPSINARQRANMRFSRPAWNFGDPNDPHQVPGQPKPRKLLGIVYNTKVRTMRTSHAPPRRLHLTATAPQAIVFWTFVFFVPPVIMIAWNGGRLSMSRQELLESPAALRRVRATLALLSYAPAGRATPSRPRACCPVPAALARPSPCECPFAAQLPKSEELVEDEKQAMQRVLFSTEPYTSMRWDWAVKRDEERARKKLANEEAKVQQKLESEQVKRPSA